MQQGIGKELTSYSTPIHYIIDYHDKVSKINKHLQSINHKARQTHENWIRRHHNDWFAYLLCASL